MKIFFTGASSFTGSWFVKELAKAGHEVTAIFRKNQDAYSGVRLLRIKQILPLCQPVFNCDFGSDSFLKIIQDSSHWDLFCHHAADVTNYKSPDFEVASALANNTKNLKAILDNLKGKKCERIVLSGSIFEQNEGAGSDDLRAVSPYGLSKGLTTDFFRYYCLLTGIKLGKFVIPNPFGPYEEFRFTSFLIQNWKEGKIAPVSSPAYVRDNIHVSLLAKAYVQFSQNFGKFSVFEKINPSGYPESQGAFTMRFASEIGKRLQIPCLVDLQLQKDFPEPKVRINTDVLDTQALKWDEKKAWDELAEYYQHQININQL